MTVSIIAALLGIATNIPFFYIVAAWFLISAICDDLGI
jgi:hypothetical protein